MHHTNRNQVATFTAAVSHLAAGRNSIAIIISITSAVGVASG
jgi:hypothetical protein